MEKTFLLIHSVNDNYDVTLKYFEQIFNIEESLQLGNWTFKTTSKFDEQSFIKSEILPGYMSFCCGSIIYKNKSGKACLDKITEDFHNKQLELDKLKGNFIILIWNGLSITFINDRLGVQQLFQRSDGNCLSNSFLALLTVSGKKFKLNQTTLEEKLTTGFLTGEDTLVEGIKKVEMDFPYRANGNQISILKYPEHQIEMDFHHSGKKKSILSNIEILEDYFSELNTAKTNLTGDVGLSSGFDCRLILAAAKNTLDTPLHIHSHNTKGVHDNEIKYAKQIAKVYGAKIQLVPTKRLENAEEDLIKRTLQENVRFFDGRSARHLGSFSETYTPWYKKASMGNADYSLNGLGGELYRDSYFMGSRILPWNEWAKRFLFFPLSEYGVEGEQELQDISYRIKEKVEMKLNTNFDHADLLKTHAHYGLIKMPDSNGALAQAYGKVSEFYFPFIEYHQIMEALKAVPYLGIGGSYQAKMITTLSPEIAAIGSHYGFSFDKLSIKYMLWSYIKTKGSINTREKLVKENMLKNINSMEVKKFLVVVEKSPYLSQIKRILESYCPTLNFDIMVSHTTTRRIVLFLGAFLVEYQDYIE